MLINERRQASVDYGRSFVGSVGILKKSYLYKKQKLNLAAIASLLMSHGGPQTARQAGRVVIDIFQAQTASVSQ